MILDHARAFSFATSLPVLLVVYAWIFSTATLPSPAHADLHRLPPPPHHDGAAVGGAALSS
jgi:hypothetical protein